MLVKLTLKDTEKMQIDFTDTVTRKYTQFAHTCADFRELTKIPPQKRADSLEDHILSGVAVIDVADVGNIRL